MEIPIHAGLIVIAVSGSVAFLSLQLHKRLLSDFMKNIESEIGYEKYGGTKKRVRFDNKVMKPYQSKNSISKESKKVKSSQDMSMEFAASLNQVEELEETMPMNRRIMYKAIIEQRTNLQDHNTSICL